MKHFTETHLWEEILRDAAEHRAMRRIYYEAGYRKGIRDRDPPQFAKAEANGAANFTKID